MSRNEFMILARQHAKLHEGIIPVVGRLFVYLAILIFSMWGSDKLLHDGYTGIVSMFVLLSVIFELGIHSIRHPRLLWILVCTIGIGIAGFFLAKHSIAAQHKHCACVQAAPCVLKDR